MNKHSLFSTKIFVPSTTLSLAFSPREFVQETHSVLVLYQSNHFQDWQVAEHLYHNYQHDIVLYLFDSAGTASANGMP